MKLAVDFEKDNVFKLIFTLSYPSIIAMLVNASHNIIDGIYLGNLVGGNALAVTAVTMPIQMIFMAIGTMAPLGAASMVSMKLGSKRQGAIHTIVFTSILGAIGLSAAIFILGTIFANGILFVSGGQGELFAASKTYYTSTLIGWLFMPLSILGNNLLRTVGEAKKASWLMLVSVLVNLVMTPVFILVFDLGIWGAGLATSLAQFVSFLVMLYYFLVLKLPFYLPLRKVRFNYSYFQRMNLLGFSSFLRQGLNSMASILVNNLFFVYGGVAALNAIGIILKLNSFLLLPLFGLLHGLQPIVGYNYGLKNYPRLKEIVVKGTGISIAMAMVSFLIVEFFRVPIIGLFTQNQTFIDLAEYGMIFVMIGMPFVALQLVGSTIFQSFNKPGSALFLAIVRQVVFAIPLLLILSPKMGLQGIWLAFPLSDGLTGIVSIVIIILGLKEIKNRWENPRVRK